MNDSLRSRVGNDTSARLLSSWLAGRFRYFDEDGWRRQIAAGRVQCNGTTADEGTHVGAGDVVAFTPAPSSVEAPDVRVLHHDDDLVVVDKPAHLVVQHTGAFAHATFVASLAARFPPAPGTPRLEPVHRLDRETSGVLVLTRSHAATRALHRQFETGLVKKQYVAVVHGRLADDTRSITAPIGRAIASVVAARRAAVPADAEDARAARTDLEVEQRLPAHTLLRVTPHSGRTHQIRVHLEHLGHPLVGDKLYGRSDAQYLDWVTHLKADGDPRTRDGTPVLRQLLHAERLACLHPRSGEPITFTAPRPPDLLAFVAAAAGARDTA